MPPLYGLRVGSYTARLVQQVKEYNRYSTVVSLARIWQDCIRTKAEWLGHNKERGASCACSNQTKRGERGEVGWGANASSESVD